MYTRPYVINDVIELLTITDLADYYCCDYPKTHLLRNLLTSSLRQHSRISQELSARLF